MTDNEARLTELAGKVKSLKTHSRTWRQIGDMIGISPSLAWNIAHGKCDNVKARHFFNMPLKQVEVMPCIVCGNVHLKKTCTSNTYRKQYRVALEFSTKEEQQLMIDVLKQYGNTRKEQSLHLLKNSQP